MQDLEEAGEKFKNWIKFSSLIIPCQEQMSAASWGLSPPKGQILESPLGIGVKLNAVLVEDI